MRAWLAGWGRRLGAKPAARPRSIGGAAGDGGTHSTPARRLRGAAEQARAHSGASLCMATDLPSQPMDRFNEEEHFRHIVSASSAAAAASSQRVERHRMVRRRDSEQERADKERERVV